MRFSVKQVDNYPPVYDVKLVSPKRSTTYKVLQYVVFLVATYTIGWLFPNQTTALLNKILFGKKD